MPERCFRFSAAAPVRHRAIVSSRPHTKALFGLPEWVIGGGDRRRAQRQPEDKVVQQSPDDARVGHGAREQLVALLCGDRAPLLERAERPSDKGHRAHRPVGRHSGERIRLHAIPIDARVPMRRSA